jgi:c-di-GMP-related signal transduction protein
MTRSSENKLSTKIQSISDAELLFFKSSQIRIFLFVTIIWQFERESMQLSYPDSLIPGNFAIDYNVMNAERLQLRRDCLDKDANDLGTRMIVNQIV